LRTEDGAAEGAGSFCEESDDRLIKLCSRGVTVAGTTVCVEVVEIEDDEEVESAEEYERGDVDCELDVDNEEGSDSGLDRLRSLLYTLLRFWK